ncbi:MAG: FG-GAP repeat domain-containing protein [Kiritimatiellia bacterium]|nr:VCBS repeat-containing protein [Lentisphaerota bacterium]
MTNIEKYRCLMRMITMGLLACWTSTAAAQANLFPGAYRGDQTEPLGNYWDGVDDNNHLRVLVDRSEVLNDVGRMVNTTQSSFPNFVDMNDDGLPDLVVADTYGFLWIFYNSGEPGNPQFTQGEFQHTFLGWASKINVADWNGNRLMDVVIGTFYGDVVVLENTGSRREPRFTRGMGVPRYVDPSYGVDRAAERLPPITLGREPLLFGNYMSPWVVDWNENSRMDLLLGEGTYSANSVRLLLNAGSRNRPAFVTDRVFFLAFGEGYEQLTPAVTDYNGDGIPDLIVGTRTGELRAYKGTREAVEGTRMITAIRSTLGPAALEFEKYLDVGGKKVFSKMSNAYPCDWNEDGLVDLVLGHTDGRIYIALNQGTKTEPKYPKAEPIKGVNVDKDLMAPKNWWNGIGRDNSLGTHGHGAWDWNGLGCNAAVLLTASREANIRHGVPTVQPVDGDTFIYFRYVKDYLGWTRSRSDPYNLKVEGARRFGPKNRFLKMKIGSKYEFSFSSVFLGRQASWELVGYETFPGTANQPPRHERREITGDIRSSTMWQNNTQRFTCPGEKVGTELTFSLLFNLPPGDSQLLLDNFVLKETP